MREKLLGGVSSSLKTHRVVVHCARTPFFTLGACLLPAVSNGIENHAQSNNTLATAHGGSDTREGSAACIGRAVCVVADASR